jgi:hypothetical protein
MKFAAINILLLNVLALNGFAEEFSALDTKIQKATFEQNYKCYLFFLKAQKSMFD